MYLLSLLPTYIYLIWDVHKEWRFGLNVYVEYLFSILHNFVCMHVVVKTTHMLYLLNRARLYLNINLYSHYDNDRLQ